MKRFTDSRGQPARCIRDGTSPGTPVALTPSAAERVQERRDDGDPPRQDRERLPHGFPRRGGRRR